MSETTDTVETPAADEKTLLKQRATMMGITFSNNISVEALRAKIEAKMAEPTEAAPAPALVAPGEVAPVRQKTKREELLADAMKLVRLRITNLDPKKKDLPGEIFTVANRYIGTVRKYVPFGEVTDNGWHVPNIIYQMMKEKKFLNIRTTRRNGKEFVEKTWAQEFALEVLPQLTREELAKLAAGQAAAGGLD